MKKIISIFFSFLILFPVCLYSDPAKESLTTVKKMINFIRYKKNESAIKLIDIETFSKSLLQEEYETLSEEQKKKFQDTIQNYIISKSFPLALKYFQKIDLTYEKPILKGKEVEIPASLLYQGSEKVQFSWILAEKNGTYLVKDFLTEKKLASEVNRKQILPIFKQKGFEELIRQIEKASK